MIYSKELRDWSSQIQSNVHAAAAVKNKNGPQTGGSFIRELVIRERTELGSQPTPPSLTERLWNDVEKKSELLRETIPLITQEHVPRVIDVKDEDEE